MARATISFTDSRGRLHKTPEAATVSDLADLFGGMEGMAHGIGHSILRQRAEIEKIFAELDEAKGNPPPDV